MLRSAAVSSDWQGLSATAAVAATGVDALGDDAADVSMPCGCSGKRANSSLLLLMLRHQVLLYCCTVRKQPALVGQLAGEKVQQVTRGCVIRAAAACLCAEQGCSVRLTNGGACLCELAAAHGGECGLCAGVCRKGCQC